MVTFPFSAVVGMDDLRLALTLNAVSPALGGVLVRGDKGTAKSTAVRALAALLPPVTVVTGCRFSCDPAAPAPACPDGPHPDDAAASTRPAHLVELPVGASEDRVTGALDLDRALSEGVSALRPGLLAAAHRGLLYVDEVNLLGDHLVDLLLDAAALGVAHVERDGVSVTHPARFWLVGTMNPEEGELRPQLSDRFGLMVRVAASRDRSLRAEVVRRRLAFDADPAAFAAGWAAQEATLAGRIAEARARLGSVLLGERALAAVTAVCAACDVDGMRADVVLAKTAMALAAWEGRGEVAADDIRRSAMFVLPHRRRRGPFDPPDVDDGTLAAQVERALAEVYGAGDDPDDPGGAPPPRGEGEGESGAGASPDRGGDAAAGPTTQPGDSPVPVGAAPPAGGPSADGTPADALSAAHPASAGPASADPTGGAASHAAGSGGAPNLDGGADGLGGAGGEGSGPAGPGRAAGMPGMAYRPRLFTAAGLGAGSAGRRSAARTGRGAVVAARPDAPGLHLPATLAAAAPHQLARGRGGAGPPLLRPADRRGALRVGREGNLVLFVVDASGSMAARSRLKAATTAVLSLLVDAYQRRDRVGMITFRGSGAQVVLPPTTSVEVGAARLAMLPTGGRTPIAAGLIRAGDVLRAERRRDPRRRPLLVVVTDGRATAGSDPLPVARALARSGGGPGAGGRGGGGGAGAGGLTSVVVDCETGFVRLGLAGMLAEALGATVVGLDALPGAAGRTAPRTAGNTPSGQSSPTGTGPGGDIRTGAGPGRRAEAGRAA